MIACVGYEVLRESMKTELVKVDLGCFCSEVPSPTTLCKYVALSYNVQLPSTNLNKLSHMWHVSESSHTHHLSQMHMQYVIN